MGSTVQYIDDKENIMYDSNASFFETSQAFNLMILFEGTHEQIDGRPAQTNLFQLRARW